MSNAIDGDDNYEHLDEDEKSQLPHNSCNLFAFSSDGIKLEDKHYKDGELPQNCFSAFKKQRDIGQFCDVTLVAGADGTRILAHRVILAGGSDYFTAMFTSKMKEATETEITMENVRGDVLEAIINYCYTGTIVIALTNVEAVYALAHLMQLNKIVKACSLYLVAALHPTNCVQMKLFAEMMNNTTLLDKVKPYLEKNFVEVIEHKEFLHLNLDQLKLLLERSHLKLEREEDRFNALKNWINHNPSERRTHIPSLLPFVKFDLLESEFVVSTVAEFFQDQPAYTTMLIDLLKSHLIDKTRQRTGEERNVNQSTELTRVLIVGAYVSNQDVEFNSNIECYHPQYKTWSRSHNMFDNRSDFQIAVLDENLYVIGGTRNGRIAPTMVCLNLRSGIWSESAPMSRPRRNFHTVVLDGYIYAISGCKDDYYSNSMERWQPPNTAWAYVASLPTERNGGFTVVAPERCILGVAAVDGKLYAIQDIDPRIGNRKLKCYNPKGNAWTQCQSLPCAGMPVSVIAANHCLFVIIKGSDTYFPHSLLRYDPGKNGWEIVAHLSIERSIMATCLLENRILIITDIDETSSKPNMMQECDLTSNKVTTLTFLRFPMKNVCLAVVPAEFT